MNPNGSVRCPREKKCRVLRPRSARFHPAARDSAAPQSPTFSLSRPARVDASDRLQSLAWRRDLEGGFVQNRRKHRGPPACRLARRPRAAQSPLSREGSPQRRDAQPGSEGPTVDTSSSPFRRRVRERWSLGCGGATPRPRPAGLGCWLAGCPVRSFRPRFLPWLRDTKRTTLPVARGTSKSALNPEPCTPRSGRRRP